MTDPERLAEPLTDVDYTVDGNGTRLAIVNADVLDALTTRLAAAEAQAYEWQWQFDQSCKTVESQTNMRLAAERTVREQRDRESRWMNTAREFHDFGHGCSQCHGDDACPLGEALNEWEGT